MADHSTIEWTNATWNPITGCSIASPGCKVCYAMKLAGTRLQHHASRAGLTVNTKSGPVWTGEVRFNEQWLDQPLRWKRPRRIFVCAHGDLFAENVPDEWIDKVFAVMALAPQHTFQVLTKRADRMLEYIDHSYDRTEILGDLMGKLGGSDRAGWYAPECDGKRGWASMHLPLPNVWLGVSIEDQQRANLRYVAMHRLAAFGWTAWVSYEPAIGPVDWVGWEFLKWIVSGGESGPRARPSHPDWHRSTRDFCEQQGIAYLFKQWGAWTAFYDRDQDDPDWRSVPNVDGQMRPGATCFHNLAGGMGFHGARVVAMRHVGKKAAGRLLDGREHNQFPLVAP